MSKLRPAYATWRIPSGAWALSHGKRLQLRVKTVQCVYMHTHCLVMKTRLHALGLPCCRLETIVSSSGAKLLSLHSYQIAFITFIHCLAHMLFLSLLLRTSLTSLVVDVFPPYPVWQHARSFLIISELEIFSCYGFRSSPYELLPKI